MSASRRLHQSISHLLPQSLSVVSTINSLLRSLNPQNPKTHQNPDPSILNQFSPCLNPDLVIEIVRTQTSPYHSLFFFSWASTPNPNPNHYRHSHFCYIAIADKLLSHKLFSLAADLLKTHDRFSDFMVGKFIKAHGDSGHLKSAAKLFQQVKSRELEGCLFSYNALLGVLVKAKKIGVAWGYFAQVVVKSGAVKPDVSTYTTMIRGLCKVGMIEDAEKLFDEMPVMKNLTTYNVMIDGFTKKGLMGKAQDVVDRMVGGESYSPDIVSFTTLIDGYCKKGDTENALRCFQGMASKGNCEPNLLTHNALINGLCLNGHVDEARKMMSKMRLSGVRDNIATHTSLLKGYCIANRSDEAIKHFKEMVNLGMSLDEKSYAVIVNEYCKLGRPDEAIAILREMRVKGINPSLASFNSVLRSFVRSQEFDTAILVLKQMPHWGCYPNFISYSEVITGLAWDKGRIKDVNMLVNDMIREGHGLDTTLYCCLIRAYCAIGDVTKAVPLFEEMMSKGLVIRKDCFEVLVKELGSRGLPDEAGDLFTRMINSCSTCDAKNYRRVLDECLGGNGWKATGTESLYLDVLS